MEKTLDILMEQAEDCLRKYSEKQTWTAGDLEPIRAAVSIYDKLLNITMKCEANEQHDRESYRSYGMRYTAPHYAHGPYEDEYRTGRSPRYYEYDGSLTSYRDGDRSMRRRSYRRSYGDPMSTHSIEDRMVASLEDMMADAKTDYEREKIMEFINLAKSREKR